MKGFEGCAFFVVGMSILMMMGERQLFAQTVPPTSNCKELTGPNDVGLVDLGGVLSDA